MIKSSTDKISHQLTALSMMREKELGILKGSMFPSLWEISPNSDMKTKQVFSAQVKDPMLTRLEQVSTQNHRSVGSVTKISTRGNTCGC